MYLLELKNKPEEGRVCQLPHLGHFTGAVNAVAQYSQSIPLNLCPQLSQTNFVIPLNISYSFRVWTIAPNRPPACGYCIPDDRFWFGRTKVLISCDPYKSIMVHGLQIHFNFSVFPIVVMLLFLFYGCKDTTKLCQIVAWQRRKETLFPNLSCIKDKTTPLENGRQSLKNGHGACPKWVTCLPRLGTICAHFRDV